MGLELALVHYANEKTWMTKKLLVSSPKLFDCFPSHTPSHMVLLLLERFSANGNEERLPPLDNVHVLFLPLSITNKVQLLEAGYTH